MSFRTELINYNGIDSVLLCKDNLVQAVIALQGATLIDLNFSHNSKKFKLIDGYKNIDEIKTTAGSRSAIMAPFSNRIRDNQYEFNGVTYLLSENVTPPVMHGFVKRFDFNLISGIADQRQAKVILTCDKIRKGFHPGYPFDIDVKVEYILTEDSLSLNITGTNRGSEPAPYGAGWHPYFCIGDEPVDDLFIELNAGSIIATDENYVPLEDTDAYCELTPENDFYFGSDIPLNKRKAGSKKINYCFAGLLKNKEGFSEAKLISEREGIALTITNSGNVFYIFTADGLAVRPRTSIAIEPVEYMTNGFNRPEYKDTLVLPPGEEKVFKSVVSWKKS